SARRSAAGDVRKKRDLARIVQADHLKTVIGAPSSSGRDVAYRGNLCDRPGGGAEKDACHSESGRLEACHGSNLVSVIDARLCETKKHLASGTGRRIAAHRNFLKRRPVIDEHAARDALVFLGEEIDCGRMPNGVQVKGFSYKIADAARETGMRIASLKQASARARA